jgi:uracil phosphoribosyltransferase
MYFASIISSRQGVETLQKNFGNDCEIWTTACDPKINSHGYIVPGLGDAGDLCFGQKL